MNCWLLSVVAIGVGSWGPTRRMQPYQELAARGGWLKWKARTVARHDRQHRCSSRGDPKPSHVNYLVHLCSLIQWRSTTSCSMFISILVDLVYSQNFSFVVAWIVSLLSFLWLCHQPLYDMVTRLLWISESYKRVLFLLVTQKFFLWLIEKKASATKFWILLQNPKGQILLPLVFLFFFSFVNLHRFDSFLHKPTCKRRIWHN